MSFYLNSSSLKYVKSQRNWAFSFFCFKGRKHCLLMLPVLHGWPQSREHKGNRRYFLCVYYGQYFYFFPLLQLFKAFNRLFGHKALCHFNWICVSSINIFRSVIFNLKKLCQICFWIQWVTFRFICLSPVTLIRHSFLSDVLFRIWQIDLKEQMGCLSKTFK